MEPNLDQYWCYNCERAFKTFKSVMAHCNDLGHKRGYHCLSCSEILISEAKLAAHYASEHYPCTSCKNVFSTADILKQHRQMAHAIPCPFCGKSFKSLESLESHKKGVHPFKCADCQLYFNTKDEKATHDTQAHTVVCPKCLKIFKSLAAQLEHSRQVKHLQCRHCDLWFTKEDALKIHYELTHRFRCICCKAIFLTQKYLDKHIDTEHHYQCEVCQEILRTTNARTEHQVVCQFDQGQVKASGSEAQINQQDLVDVEHQKSVEAISVTQPHFSQAIDTDHHYQFELFSEIFLNEAARKELQNICQANQEQVVKANETQLVEVAQLALIDVEQQESFEFTQKEVANSEQQEFIEVTQQKFVEEKLPALVEATQQGLTSSRRPNSTRYPCEMCGDVFYNTVILRDHEIDCRVKMEKFNREYEEKMAKKSELQLPEIKRQEPVENERPVYYPCDVCSQVFLTSNSRKEHQMECRLQEDAAIQVDQEQGAKIGPQIAKSDQEPIDGQDQEVDLIDFEEHKPTNLYYGDSMEIYKRAVQSYGQGLAEANYHLSESEILGSIEHYDQLLDLHQFSEAEEEELIRDGKEECEWLKAEERLEYIHTKDKHEKILGNCQICQAFFIQQLAQTTYGIQCPARLDGEPCPCIFEDPIDLINHVMEKHTGRCEKCPGVLFANLPAFNHHKTTFHATEAKMVEPIIKIKVEADDKENIFATIPQKTDLNGAPEVIEIKTKAQDVGNHAATLLLTPKVNMNSNAPAFAQVSTILALDEDFGCYEEDSGGQQSATDASSITATVGHPAKEEESDISGPMDFENDAILFPVLLPSTPFKTENEMLLSLFPISKPSNF